MPASSIKYKRMVKYIKTNVKQIVAERRAYLENNKKSTEEYDLLDVMITTPIAHDNGRPIYMSSQVIEFNLITVLSAGQATTTSLMSWFLNHLFHPNLGNSNFRYQLFQEIDSIARGNRNYRLSVSEIYTKLPLLTQSVLVCLYLLPPLLFCFIFYFYFF